MLMNRAPTFCSTAAANAASRLVVGAGGQHLQPSPQRLRRRLQIPGISLRVGIGRIHQQAEHHSGRHGLAHQFQPFGSQHVHEIGHAGDVAARPAETPHQSNFDGVLADHEDDRNRARRSLRRQCGWQRLRGNDARLPADQVEYQTGQPVDLAVRPAGFEGHVAAIGDAPFVQALAKCRLERRERLGRSAENSDCRHCRLLRPRRERR
jgi:hypothetical protein